MTKLKKVFCINCNKPIYRPSGRINENIKLGHNFYCSRKCESQYKRKREELMCGNCGKSFFRQLSKISPYNYCSKSCAAIINNKKYPKMKEAILKTCINCGEKYKKSTKNIKYCSIACRRKAEGYTPNELLEIIKNTAKKLGRTPARRELIKGTDKICKRVFGSWNNAVVTAGLQPNRSDSQRMYRRTNTKAADGHLCDSVSESIIDNWLTKNKIFHKRNVCYPKTNHRADWEISIRGKKAFVEYFGLANDSRRYDRTVKEKMRLCNKYKISLISIYPKELYPRRFLENNLKEKFREVI